MTIYSRSSIQNINNKRPRIWRNNCIITFIIDHFNDSKAFIEYSNDIHDVYKNIDEYKIDKENKILIAFDVMIADMIHNKKLNSIVTELFISGRKLNIFLFLLPNHILKFQKMLD